MRKHELSASEIGKRLKDARTKLHIQQNDMAAAINKPASYLCEIEKGRVNPGPEFFVKLAAQFNINLNYLFMGAPDMLVDDEGKVKKQDVDLEDAVDTIEKVTWLMEHSTHIRFLVQSCINKALFDDKDIINHEIQRKKMKDKADKTE